MQEINVIEVIKQVLTECPLISQFTNEIHTDFTDEEEHSYGISSIGDSLVKKDILGNQTRQNNLVLYSVGSSINDYERLENSSFLVDLGIYLESIKGISITQELNDTELQGELLSIRCNNAMAWEMSEDGQFIKYQLQLQAKYKLLGGI